MAAPLRQVSYWFGTGASSRLDGAVTLRQASDGEDEAFAALADAERRRAHLVFIIDATGSMGQFLESLPDTLAQVFSVLGVLFGDTVRTRLVVLCFVVLIWCSLSLSLSPSPSLSPCLSLSHTHANHDSFTPKAY